MMERQAMARTLGDERLAATLALLDEGIAATLTSDGFAAYLRTLARFSTYSARNVALIHRQRPDATRVAGYRAWQTLGRQVRRGEHGLRILVPYRHAATPPDGEDATDAERTTTISGFGVVTVFDLAQTDGEPLPAPTAPQPLVGDSALARWLWVHLAAFLAGEGVTLARRSLSEGNGVYFPLTRLVVVRSCLSDEQAAKTLAHECAHHVALTRAIGAHGASRADAETIAEGAAFATLARCGIDTGDYSFPYVAAWAADRAVVTRNLAAIRETAATLIAAIEGEPDVGATDVPRAA
jgi:antirestriction protein ArdC